MKNPEINKRPIFIGGCPRSGTTMLGSMLGSAAHCIATPESYFIQQAPHLLGVDWSTGANKKELLDALSKSFQFKQWEIPVPDDSLPPILTKHDYRNLIFSLVDSYASAVNRSNWNVWVDHTPSNLQCALMLLNIFPNAKFIPIVRDPRGVAASLIPLDWGPNTARAVARKWAASLLEILAFESAFPEKCFRVKYEDIVLSPEKNLKAICDFSGITFKPSMVLGREFKPPDSRKAQHKLVGTAPNPERLDAWKRELTDWQIYEIEKFLKDFLDLMDYTKIGLKPPPPNISQKAISKVKNKVGNFIKKRRYLAKLQKYGKGAEL